MATDTTLHLQHCLDRLRAGDMAARQELVSSACQRLLRLTRKMLHADGRLRRWQETDFKSGRMLRSLRLERLKTRVSFLHRTM